RAQALPQQAPRRLVPVPALAFLQQVLRQPVLVPAQQALQQPVPVPAQQALQQLVLVLAQQAPQLQQQRRRARLLLAVLMYVGYKIVKLAIELRYLVRMQIVQQQRPL
ncbi:unnamed protein product, partial [Rotaria magnacalcarata]